MNQSFFSTHYSEGFPNLLNPPIAEAVIEFRILSQQKWDPDKIKIAINQALPKAKKIDPTNEFFYKLSLDGAPPKEEKLGCVGFRILCEDDRFLVQFNQKSFVISCVKGYKTWESFIAQAEIYWKKYCELILPEEVKRIGVRFINKMPIKSDPFSASEYFIYPPPEKQVDDWDLSNFLYKDSLIVVGTPYRVNLIKTISAEQLKANTAIVFDIDIFSTQNVSCDWKNLEEHLVAIRSIKNKAFFGNVPKKKIEEFLK